MNRTAGIARSAQGQSAMKNANASHFENHFARLNEGGVYMWKDEGHIYTKKGNKVVASTRAAWDDINRITPRGWAKNNVKLANTRPTSRPTTTIAEPPADNPTNNSADLRGLANAAGITEDSSVEDMFGPFVAACAISSPLSGNETMEELTARWETMMAERAGGGSTENPTHNCPKCSMDYTCIHPSKEEAKNSDPFIAISAEQWCSGICSDACWGSCSEMEIMVFKYLNPRYSKSAEKVVMCGPDGTSVVADGR